MVDVDVADRAQARTFYMLYFQAETIIIVSSNSESGTEDVRSRKVYMIPLARAKGKTFCHSFWCCLPCCYVPSPHCIQIRTVHDMKSANRAFQHDLIFQGHVTCTVVRGDDKMAKKKYILVAYCKLFKLLRAKNEHRELLESRIVTVKMVMLLCHCELKVTATCSKSGF